MEKSANQEKRINELIQAVAGKLLAEGLDPFNFDKNKAMEKLSQVVAPVACIKILTNFETEVKEAMIGMKIQSTINQQS